MTWLLPMGTCPLRWRFTNAAAAIAGYITISVGYQTIAHLLKTIPIRFVPEIIGSILDLVIKHGIFDNPTFITYNIL